MANTANYGWVKPDVGASDDVWGGQLNTDLDGIDGTVNGVSTVANAAYPAANPSGYQTAAQVTASLAPYALTTSVPVASSSTPVMDGTAAIGVGTTWARADHIHPTDTSLYPASNPSGYQTAAQVTTSLGSYLPLAGGTLTGQLNGTALAIGHSNNSGQTTLGVAGLGYTPAGGMIIEGTSGNTMLVCNRAGAGTNGGVINFQQGGVNCGHIDVANANATSYNTSSDVRLKTDAQSFDAGPILDATEVYNFEWTNAPGIRAYGVMAQEAAEVFPDAVSHDEVNDHWGVDYSKYVPLLINEIKALRARVAQLEGGANG